jgi:hypothetical protein
VKNSPLTKSTTNAIVESSFANLTNFLRQLYDAPSTRGGFIFDIASPCSVPRVRFELTTQSISATALYQLAYRGHVFVRIKWTRLDSNQRSPGYNPSVIYRFTTSPFVLALGGGNRTPTATCKGWCTFTNVLAPLGECAKEDSNL